MTLILLALGSAVVYGTADFFGGAASRRASVRVVLLISLPVGLVMFVVAALATGQPLDPDGLAWGFAAGIVGGASLVGFYGALARGPMSVVAPVAALVSALLPVAVGMLRGERLTVSVLIGVVICLVAICFVSMQAGDNRPRSVRGPVLAAIAGAGFGIFLILLREAGGEGELWSLAAARAGGVLISVVVTVAGWALLRRSGPRRWPALRRRSAAAPGEQRRAPVGGDTLVIASAAGILDSLANLLYLLATREGMLSLAAVLTSMYPAVTVLLARIVYSERLRLVQRFGIVLALTGVALVTVG